LWGFLVVLKNPLVIGGLFLSIFICGIFVFLLYCLLSDYDDPSGEGIINNKITDEVTGKIPISNSFGLKIKVNI
jgi:hypothetical protein